MLAGAALLSHPSTCAILRGVGTARPSCTGGSAARSCAARRAGSAWPRWWRPSTAFVLYYAWFPAVYLQRAGPGRVGNGDTGVGSTSALRLAHASRPIPDLAGSYFGWPAVAAAVSGRGVLSRGTEPRALDVAAAWLGSGRALVFLVIGVLTPVEMRYHFAAFPAVALAAAYGSSWAWRGRLPLRIGATLVLGAATWVGVQTVDGDAAV